MIVNSGHIPNYLTAGSPQGLRRLMLLNNTKKGMVFAYTISFAAGKWYAWYNDSYEALVQEVVDGSEK
jgi:hypothetical protein